MIGIIVVVIRPETNYVGLIVVVGRQQSQYMVVL